MNKRRGILIGIGALVLLGIGNFIVNTVQTRSQLGQVGSKDAPTQETGIKALMGRGVLFDALQGSAPPPVRLAAIATLTRMSEGGKDKAAFEQLLQMLKDPDTESAEQKTHPVRDAAKDAVAKVGASYPDILLDACKNPDGNIRDQSRNAVRAIGAPLKEKMAARLGDGDLRAPLGDILSSIGPETIPLITPYLKEQLDKGKDADTGAKLQLIEIMGKFKVAEAATPILPFQNDPEPNVRRSVVTSLANIGDKVGAPVLITALGKTDTDASARAAAAGALGAIATPEANASMLKALSDYDVDVAKAAAAGLARAGDAAAPQIAAALSNADPRVRLRGAEATSGLRQPNLAAKALTDTNSDVRTAAASSLGTVLARAQAIRKALTTLSSGAKETTEAAWTELQRQGGTEELQSPSAGAAKQAVVALLTEKASAEKDDAKKKPFTDQIEKLNAPGAPSAPLPDPSIPTAYAPLLNTLSDADGEAAMAASTALARLGKAVVPALSQKLASPNETVAYLASQALTIIGRDAVDGLLPAAQSGAPTARWAAVTLGQIGDPRAEPALQALTSSTDPDTAYAAQTALARVKPTG
ncbi:MAG: HEAT repeat domain-containing protein [Armatimonas sp.]